MMKCVLVFGLHRTYTLCIFFLRLKALYNALPHPHIQKFIHKRSRKNGSCIRCRKCSSFIRKQPGQVGNSEKETDRQTDTLRERELGRQEKTESSGSQVAMVATKTRSPSCYF